MSGRIEVAGLTIDLDPVEHALLGRAHRILRGTTLLTHVSAIDWDRPAHIPAIAAPGALPAGTGGAIMNVLAERALAAGVPSLRYAGPYPTPALYRTLLRSFRASADEETFTRDLLDRASRLARDEIAVDFVPAPHRRVEHAHGVSEVRDGLERTMIDGIAYERDGDSDDNRSDDNRSDDRVGTRVATVVTTTSPTRLIRDGDLYAAEVWFGDSPYARVARLTADGQLVDGPHPIPPMSSSQGAPMSSSHDASMPSSQSASMSSSAHDAPMQPSVHGPMPSQAHGGPISSSHGGDPMPSSHGAPMSSSQGAPISSSHDASMPSSHDASMPSSQSASMSSSAHNAPMRPSLHGAMSSSVLGKAFPPPLAAALGELVADLVPAPLATGAKQLLAARPIIWADLGARAARATATQFEVHAALWERIAPLGMARLALALAEALAPVVTTTLAGLLQSQPSSRPLP